jgi:hypothetical protein
MRRDPHRDQLDGRRGRLVAVPAGQANDLIVECGEEGCSVAPTGSRAGALHPLSIWSIRLGRVRRTERRRSLLERGEPHLLQECGITLRDATNLHPERVVRQTLPHNRVVTKLPPNAGLVRCERRRRRHPLTVASAPECPSREALASDADATEHHAPEQSGRSGARPPTGAQARVLLAPRVDTLGELH